MRLFGILALCFSLQAVFAQQPAVNVWAVSENVRVNPVTGKLIEARTDIHRDYPAEDYRQGNLAWDASRKAVSLKAARNEFVGFQLIIETNAPVEDVDVALTELRHESGATITGKHLAVFQEWYIQVRKPSTGYEATSLGAGWYPDALMPKRRSGLLPGFPFEIPDRYNNISDQRNQAVWVDIYVPEDASAASAGRYAGRADVTWKGGSSSVALELDVWNFALPQDNHLPGDIWNDSMRNMSPEEELQYYQMAKQHRFLPLIYGYRPELKAEGNKISLDWTEYDRRLGKYFDGSAFTGKHGYWGPGYGVPVRHMMLPFNIHDKEKNKGVAWPIDVPDEGRTPEYEKVWKDVARQVREHLDSNPAWRKVKKIAFLNGLDESYYEDAYEKMLYYGRVLHEGMGRGWFQYRIDGGYDREAMEKLSKEVDLWICHSVSFDKETVDYFRPKGVETWFYGPMIYEQKRNSGCGSNTFLDLDLLVNRAIGWIGWKYQTGWVEWEFDWNAYASWYEAENFKDDHRAYNGSGQLIYRGDVMRFNGPVPSIRLKATRRGLQDYEYFWLLAQTAGGKQQADDLVNAIVYKQPFGPKAMRDTEIWKNNPDQWDRVRLQAGAMLDAR
ncbi:MAG: DUF4091 domain-containing protein [Acidobacteria bacterium]|nr:DUF4091 domain-containing protein [Acidobacteriota bacterium]